MLLRWEGVARQTQHLTVEKLVTIQPALRRWYYDSKHVLILPWSCWKTPCFPSFCIMIPAAPEMW